MSKTLDALEPPELIRAARHHRRRFGIGGALRTNRKMNTSTSANSEN
jgi:hypothetical protein